MTRHSAARAKKKSFCNAVRLLQRCGVDRGGEREGEGE
jgi:hypothetical protein